MKTTKFATLWRPRRITVLALITIFALALGGFMTASAQDVTPTPVIVTDKADYMPGEIVTVTGSNWVLDSQVFLVADDDPASPWVATATVDVVDGGFTWSFQLPVYFFANYTVTATGVQSGLIATTTFTDLSIGTYDQCSNDDGDGYDSGDLGCRWINGNLNANNSTYFEDDATVQRAWLTDFLPGEHTVTFEYGTTKGGKHAYDFLTTWNWSETWITEEDLCQDIAGCSLAGADYLDIPQDPMVPDSFEPSAPGDRQFMMIGGDMTSATTPAIYSGDYTSDSETIITITFTVPESGPLCETDGKGVTTCDVAIWFGAHIAFSDDWGADTGASSIPGSPYHVALFRVDGASVGKRDNQMQSDTIPMNYDLTVTKTAVPHFTRTFAWDITKVADETYVEIAAGGSYTFNYTVGVTHNAGTDSGWVVDGLITVSNPNGVDIPLDSVLDAVDNGGVCAVAEGPYVVPAGGTLDIGYICTYASAPTSLTGTNTATVTWDSAAYRTPSGTAFGTMGFDFATATPALVDESIDVSDTYADVLGTATYTDPSPKYFYYSRTESGVAGTCTDYDNTASFVTVDLALTDSADETVTICVGLDLTVTKTAAGTYDREYLWDIDKDVDKTSVNIAFGTLARFNYTVDVWQTGVLDSGWEVHGTITVSNPNDWEAITLTTLTDVVDNGGICTVEAGPYVVPAAVGVVPGTLVKTYTCTFAAEPTSYTGINTATATWDAAAFFTPTGTDSGTAGFTLAQDVLTNKTVHVTDTLGGALGSVVGTDAVPWASAEFTYYHDFPGLPGTCKTYDNTATITETGDNDSVTVEVCTGVDLRVIKTASASKDRLYKWLIDKSVDNTLIKISGGVATFNYEVLVTPDGFVDSDFVLGGKIQIINPNDWEAITVNVEDVIDQGGICTIVEEGPYVVPAKVGDVLGKLTLNYTCDTDGTTTLNTVNVTWDKEAFHTPTGMATDDAPVTFVLDVVTNKVITVIDDKTDPLHPVELGTWDWSDGPHTFEYALDLPGVPGECVDYTNTAWIEETGQDDSQLVTVCQGADLIVTKTASASFDREYLWLIDKMVDQTHVDTTVGGLATFNYTVTVTPNGFEDSGWEVHGTITITNPNDWQAVEVDVTDAVDVGGGAVCTVVGGVDVVVPASDSVVLNYSCTFSTKPAYTGVNTATATWDMALYSTPSGSDSGTADVDFIMDQETNMIVDVWDDKTDPLTPVYLGPATWNDIPEATVFTYALTKEAGFGCMTYTNTAVIEQTEQEASVTIEICGDYWAFTPGFWKNHTAASPSGHDAWQWTFYLTTDLVGDVFDPDDSLIILTEAVPGAKYGALGGYTLLEALSFKGGSGEVGAAQILLRAGTAALLNASFHEYWGHPVGPSGYYPYSSAEIIFMVHEALGGTAQDMLDLASELDMYNNSAHIIDWDNPPGEF